MIYNIRGTSGSGKSTIARSVLDRCSAQELPVEEVRGEGRRKPLLYRCHPAEGRKAISLLGHYESPCGGCDTISGYDAIYDLIRSETLEGRDVLCEGLLLSEEVKRMYALRAEGFPVVVIGLTTSVDECVESVLKRRVAGGGDPSTFKPENTRRRVGVIERALVRLEEGGVTVRRMTRSEAQARIDEWAFGGAAGGILQGEVRLA